MTEVELLSKRLRTLENHFRWIKVLFVIGCVIVAALGVMGQVRGVPGEVLPGGRLGVETPGRPAVSVEAEIRSRQFILVDDTGKERASLVADRAGSAFLTMFDTAGKTRVHLSVTPDGPNLMFYDPSGQPRTVLGSTTLVA